MASDEEDLSLDENVRRSVSRTLGNTLLVLLVLVGLGAWVYFGLYRLDPGQAAIILRFGAYARTVSEPGPKWHLPFPIEVHEIVNVDEVEQLEFGVGAVDSDQPDREALLEASMQTRENAVVRLSFAVQYRVKDAFESRYRLAAPLDTLRDAAQAAVREVVGSMSIDGVLSERRDDVAVETEEILQATLDAYDSGLLVTGVQLLDVQPPAEVRAAFDDVIAAAQDASRAINTAQGYQNELLPKARGEAAEIVAKANGYRESKIAESSGEAQRFLALESEYRRAPEVTRKRLYLETMEEILPSVEKVIIEPGTASVLPYLPLGPRGVKLGEEK